MDYVLTEDTVLFCLLTKNLLVNLKDSISSTILQPNRRGAEFTRRDLIVQARILGNRRRKTLGQDRFSSQGPEASLPSSALT